MARSKVAVLRVRPDQILEDIDRLHELAGVSTALAKGARTILKDNISWHFPFPGANTTPWQLEGTIRSLRARGYDDLVCVQNKTVVTDAFKGEDLNGYVPIFKRYDIPVRYNFKPEDMTWSVYRPKAKMNVLDTIFPEGIQIPDAFHGTNIVHLPTTKCLAGDTEVMLGDGTLTTIRELVAAQIARAGMVAIDRDGTVRCDGEATVFAMANDGGVRAMRATHFARSTPAGRRIVKITLRSGRTLTATDDHPLLSARGWTETGELAVGDRIAIARRLGVAGASQALPKTHAKPSVPRVVVARAGRTYTAEYQQQVIDRYQSGETATAIAAGGGVRWQSVQAILKRHDVPMRRNVIPISVPATTSESFWRWIGYVVAEGCAEDLAKGAGKIWWTNTDPELRGDFVALTRQLFDVEARIRDAAQISIYSRDLVRFLEELGFTVPMNSGNKRLPACLWRCPDRELAAFLSAYLDGDGTVSARQAEVSSTTKSERLARDLVQLYARLGFAAFVKPVQQQLEGWSEPRTYWRVTVAGAAVARLAEVLALRHPTKRERLARHAARLAGSKQPSNWDTVPVDAPAFKHIRVELGLTQQATGSPGSVNNIENAYTRPTPRILRGLLDVFEQADHDGRFAVELAALRRLAHEDLAWDAIETIEPAQADELYDITVPEAGSFIANGVVAHNCHIYTTTTGAMKNAFGGLLNTKRHYTHSWIHATLVDLLAIQKEIHAGLFAVMDGTTAGDGPGPRTMRPVIKDVMLAAADQVAIDAVAASMMGFDPMSLEYIRLADEQGLGNGRRENIEVVGDVELADQKWGFSVGDNGASMVGDVMWFGPLKRFQKLFFHTPLVNLFVMGSEAYHDYYRWPLRDRRVFEQWKEQTTWGRLFDHYQTHGALAPAESARVG
jgi:intein/homing endonuclease